MTNEIKATLSRLRHLPFHPQWLLRFSKDSSLLLKSIQGNVLDIGCGGRWVERELPDEVSYVGLDYFETGVGLYGSVPDVFADAAWLPFSDESFDNVVMFEVLEHIAEPEKALSETCRVLRSGGQIVLTVPFLYPMHDEPYDFRRYTKYGLEKVLVNAGFHVEKIEPTLEAIESSGLLLALGLGGSVNEAIRKRHPSLVIFPFVVGLIFTVNIMAWLIARMLPNWTAYTKGWQVLAVKR